MQMKKTCENCAHFDNTGYKDAEHSKNLGFCNRFKEVQNKNDLECIGFMASTEKEEYFRNLAKAKALDLVFNNQLQLF